MCVCVCVCQTSGRHVTVWLPMATLLGSLQQTCVYSGRSQALYRHPLCPELCWDGDGGPQRLLSRSRLSGDCHGKLPAFGRCLELTVKV